MFGQVDHRFRKKEVLIHYERINTWPVEPLMAGSTEVLANRLQYRMHLSRQWSVNDGYMICGILLWCIEEIKLTSWSSPQTNDTTYSSLLLPMQIKDDIAELV